MPTSHTIAIHPTIPSFLVAAFSNSTGVAAMAGSSTSVWTPAPTAVAFESELSGLPDGSGMANPWVEDGVQDVDEEVHGDVPEGEDGHVAL